MGGKSEHQVDGICQAEELKLGIQDFTETE